jgi:hypothetical protein
VTSGQISSVSLPFAKVGATGLRTEIVGVVTLTTTSGSSIPCELVASLETYDTSSGATHLHLDQNGGLEGPGPEGRF